jgi:hypothetical protein
MITLSEAWGLALLFSLMGTSTILVLGELSADLAPGPHGDGPVLDILTDQ